jgi:predicted amidohydrolase YtcJ
MLVYEGRIAYVGELLPEEYSSAPRVDLGSRALLPALADAHMHFSSYALFESKLALDLREASSIPEVMEAIKLFTIGAARLSFDEAERGSLEAGKLADMVILDRDPLGMNKADLEA